MKTALFCEAIPSIGLNYGSKPVQTTMQLLLRKHKETWKMGAKIYNKKLIEYG